MKRVFVLPYLLFILVSGLTLSTLTDTCGEAFASEEKPVFTELIRPSVRFGTDRGPIWTLDIMIPLYYGEKDILFADPRVSTEDLDGYEVNLGLGYRRLVANDRLLLGGNVYYDTRKTDWGTYHDQWGIGLEAMTELSGIGLTARVNGYFAISEPIISAPGDADGTYRQRRDGIYFIGGRAEVPLSGFDVEIGMRVPFVSKYVETWVYGGGYHLVGKYVPNVDGYMARVEVIPTDFVRLNYEYRYDRTNYGEHYGEVMFEIPFSLDNLFAGEDPFKGLGRFGGSRTLKERMTEPVRRDIDVRIVKEDFNRNLPGVGTKVEDVVFVSESAPAGGNGSLNRPYDAISDVNADGRVGTSIYTVCVLNDDPGAGAAAGGTINNAKNDILVWGSGVPHPRYPNIINITSGYPTIGTNLIFNGAGVTIMGLEVGAGLNLRLNGSGSTARNMIVGNNLTVDALSLGTHIYDSTIGNNLAFGGANGLISGVDVGNSLTLSGADGIITGVTVGNSATLSGDRSLMSDSRVGGTTALSGADGTISDSELFGALNITGSNALVSGNTLTVAGDHAIRLLADGNGVSILNNIITLTNAAAARGIDNSGGVGLDLGNPLSYAIIQGNTISVTTTAGNAFGIDFGRTATLPDAVYAIISDNIMSVSAAAAGYGVRIVTGVNGIGTAAAPTYFTGNSGTISGTSRYLVRLNPATPLTSYFDMGTGISGFGSNGFTANGPWSGDYPAAGGPVREDSGDNGYIHP